MGCAPGGACCESCKQHRMGDTQCDSDGNCYTQAADGSYQLTAAPATTGPGCGPGVTNCGGVSTITSALGNVSPTWLYVGAGLLLVLLLEGHSRRR